MDGHRPEKQTGGLEKRANNQYFILLRYSLNTIIYPLKCITLGVFTYAWGWAGAITRGYFHTHGPTQSTSYPYTNSLFYTLHLVFVILNTAQTGMAPV